MRDRMADENDLLGHAETPLKSARKGGRKADAIIGSPDWAPSNGGCREATRSRSSPFADRCRLIGCCARWLLIGERARISLVIVGLGLPCDSGRHGSACCRRH